MVPDIKRQSDMTDSNTLYNSEPEQRATEGLKAILLGGASMRSGWLGYGTALNEIKAQYPGNNNAFGAAVKSAKLDVWPDESGRSNLEQPIHKAIRSAAMWAAALKPDELAALAAKHPNVEVTVRGGFRGLYAAVTNAAKQAETTAQDHTAEQDDNEVSELDDQDDRDPACRLIEKRMVGLFSKEFALEYSEVTGDIYVTINSKVYYLSVQELGEDGNIIR